MSSDDLTKDLPGDDGKMDTKPTIETVLERINALAVAIEKRFESVELRLNRIDSRMDRLENMVLELRADSRDLRDQLKEHFPALK